MITLFARKPETRTILLFAVTDEGKLLKKLEYTIQDEKGRLRWPKLSPGISHMKSVLRRVLRKGSTEVRVIKIPVSKAKLVECLRSEKICFKWKTYTTRKHLVNFLILLRGGMRIVLDVAYPYENVDEQERLISERKKYLLDNGYLYYWVTVNQLYLKFYNITKILKNIIKREEVRPPGPLMDIVRLEETSIPIEFLLRLEVKESAPNARIRIGVYEVVKTEEEETLSNVGEIEVEKRDTVGFAQSLCNLLGERIYYSYNIGDYEKLYNQLIEENQAKISVKKIHVDSRELLTRQLMDNFTDDLLRKVMSATLQLLKDHQTAQLESIPLEVVRSFFEGYICKMRPLTGERLEKLISHGLLNENKKRTVIGRIIMKAYRETMKNQTYTRADTEHMRLNNSGADLYG